MKCNYAKRMIEIEIEWMTPLSTDEKDLVLKSVVELRLLVNRNPFRRSGTWPASRCLHSLHLNAHAMSLVKLQTR